MCEGPHVHTTKDIPRDGFKIRSVAGAYWRGNSDNVMMTRIYAWAFLDKETLDSHVEAYELALARDHKKLGRELGIYAIDNDIGKGLPLWLPNGTIVRDELENLAKNWNSRRATYVWQPRTWPRNLSTTPRAICPITRKICIRPWS